MPKVDAKKEFRHLYGASAERVDIVDVPQLPYLMIDGKGDPNSSSEYADAVEGLFSVAYKAKFIVKKQPEQVDYAVMPLEGLWWSDDLASFVRNERSKWSWTMMIMQPPAVSDEVIRAAVAEVSRKKSLPALGKLRFELFTEGLCAQTLHIGPFTDEGPTIERVHAFIATRARLAGKHHEIYLSDIRRTAPSRWKTIIRQPMQ